MNKCICLSFLIFCLTITYLVKNNYEENQADNINNPNNPEIIDLKLNEVRCGKSVVSIHANHEKIRVLICFLGSKEMEISADKKIFWFWSKSFDAKSIYYCNESKISQTRVRPFLYPCVLRSLICIEQKPKAGIASLGDDLKRETFIADDMVSKHIFYKGESAILTVIFLGFQKHGDLIFPKKARIIIHEEEISLDLEIGKVLLNTGEDIETKMPENFSRVNLESY